MLTKNHLLSTTLFILFSLLSNSSFAQGVEMAEQFRSSGKIYVVVAVLCLVFLGIITYLLMIERRLKKLENQQKNKA